MAKYEKSKENRYETFEDFYPFYLTQHSVPWCRRFHLMGTTIALFFMISMIFIFNLKMILYAILVGYGFSWTGHFCFQKNKPAAFRYPVYSFMGDWKMWWEWVIGEKPF